MENTNFEITLKIGFKNGMLGPGIIDFLELVNETGSMQSACEKMGMSYSKSWRLVSYAENAVGKTLLIREAGGIQGGGSTLTDDAKKIITGYRSFTKLTFDFAESKYIEIAEKFF